MHVFFFVLNIRPTYIKHNQDCHLLKHRQLPCNPRILAAWIQRDDDKEETVKKRLAVYHEQTEVLVDFYSKLEGEHAPKYIKVDGTQPVEAVKAEVLGALGK